MINVSRLWLSRGVLSRLKCHNVVIPEGRRPAMDHQPGAADSLWGNRFYLLFAHNTLPVEYFQQVHIICSKLNSQ